LIALDLTYFYLFLLLITLKQLPGNRGRGLSVIIQNLKSVTLRAIQTGDRL
jgi:hypothetical protein